MQDNTILDGSTGLPERSFSGDATLASRANVAASPSTPEPELFPSKANGRKYKNLVLELEDYPSKPGKKKRRRARLLILLEDEDERVRWWLWLLLAGILGIIAAGVTLIVMYAINRDSSGDGSAVQRRIDLNLIDVEAFESCQQLVERLWDSSQLVTLGPNAEPGRRLSTWTSQGQNRLLGEQSAIMDTAAFTDYEHVQIDVTLPVKNSASGDIGGTIYYSVAGAELVVFRSVGGNSSSIVQRINLRGLDILAEQAPVEPLQLFPDASEEEEEEAISVPVGVKQTLTASQLILPQGASDVLVVLGTSLEFTGGASTLIQRSRGGSAAGPASAPGPAGMQDGEVPSYFYSDVARPFPAVVALFFDISVPEAPVAVSVATVEGGLLTARSADGALWLLLRQSPHVPYTAAAAAPQAPVGADVMPVLRHWSGPQEAPVPWDAIATCSDVQYFATTGVPSPRRHLVTAVPLQLARRALGQPLEGASLHMALGWPPQVEGWTMRENVLALAENVLWRSGGPVIPTSDSGIVPTASTAVASFNMTSAGALRINHTLVVGELWFRGAMQLDASQMRLLTTVSYDGSGEQVVDSSNFYVLQHDLIVVANRTQLFSTCGPAGMLTTSGSTPDKSLVAVACPFSSPPAIHVFDYRTVDPASADVAVAAGGVAEEVPSTVIQSDVSEVSTPVRIRPSHKVHLMKWVQVGPRASGLFLAGPHFDSSQGTALELSLYGSAATNPKKIGTFALNGTAAWSEAFLDNRALQLQSTEEGVTLALPLWLSDAACAPGGHGLTLVKLLRISRSGIVPVGNFQSSAPLKKACVSQACGMASNAIKRVYLESLSTEMLVFSLCDVAVAGFSAGQSGAAANAGLGLPFNDIAAFPLFPNLAHLSDGCHCDTWQ